jgi:hypothetical protein
MGFTFVSKSNCTMKIFVTDIEKQSFHRLKYYVDFEPIKMSRIKRIHINLLERDEDSNSKKDP